MRRYPPEDAHGAGHYYCLIIIRKSSEPFRSLLGYLQPMANYWLAQTYQHVDCDIPLNKYPVRSGRSSKVKWFAQVHNTLAVAGLKLTTFRLWVLRCSARSHVPSLKDLGACNNRVSLNILPCFLQFLASKVYQTFVEMNIKFVPFCSCFPDNFGTFCILKCFVQSFCFYNKNQRNRMKESVSLYHTVS